MIKRIFLMRLCIVMLLNIFIWNIDVFSHNTCFASIFDLANVDDDKEQDIKNKENINTSEDDTDDTDDSEKYSDKKFIKNIKNALSPWARCFNAKMIAVDIASGGKQIVMLRRNSITRFMDLGIEMNACWRECGKIYAPETKAVISIHDFLHNNTIFSGWMFARYRSLNQPVYKGRYFFYLM